jgi:hypothetical protein
MFQFNLLFILFIVLQYNSLLSPVEGVKQTRDKSPKSKEAGYYSKKEYIKRKAETIFKSGSDYTIEESHKLAEKIITERNRNNSRIRREKNKALGIKEVRYRRPGSSTKESVIGRKITQILGEQNSIVRHDDTKELAEKWYSEYHKTSSAQYRQRQKQKRLDATAEEKAKDNNNNVEKCNIDHHTKNI